MKTLSVSLFIILLALPAIAQSVQPVDFLKNLGADQKAIWMSPAHAGKNLDWLIPLAAATAGLIATDHQTAAWVPPSTVPASTIVSDVGVGYMGALPAGLILSSLATHDKRARGTGVLALESLANAEAVVELLKYGFMRQRPPDGGRWFRPNGDPSFPSGHSAGVWAVSTLVASEYHSPLVAALAYGAAAAVSGSRFTTQRHHLSDILIGSAIGFGIGRYVGRHHPIQPAQ